MRKASPPKMWREIDIMFDKRLAVQTYPDQQIREFHVTGAVSNTRIFEVSRDRISKYPLKSTYGIEADSETRPAS